MSLYVNPPISGFSAEWARQITTSVNFLLRSQGQFPAYDADPADPVAGQTYLNTATGKVRTWTGTLWVDLN